MSVKTKTVAPFRAFRPGREIFYQIFPDRWRRSSSPSDAKVPSELGHREFFGGDLNGIIESIPYLLQLGVTALYLNPIFSAGSTHRYDAINYFEIDKKLGTKKDFKNLASALRENGILLVLDGVLNHTSHEHPWHRDIRQRKKHYIMKDAEKTMTWFDRGTLPKLDLQNEEIAKKLLKVLDAWPEADGWRLDAGHLLPEQFLRDVRARIGKKFLLIEDWILSPHYSSKKLADGVTNFLFRENCRTFFTEDSSPETFLSRAESVMKVYSPRFVNMSWNFLDNHDTGRFVSICGRPRLFRAFLLLFTLPGMPMLFQGAEMGLSGKSEHESRRPISWREKDWDLELLQHVRALSKIRSSSPALCTGTFAPLFADNRSRTLVFERRLKDERVIVAINDGYRSCNISMKSVERKLNPGESFIRIERRRRASLEFIFEM